MTQPFSHTIALDMTSVDFDGRWQPGAIFRAMQDASGEHCAALHLTYEELLRQGLAWVLTHASLCMDEYPVLGQCVTVSTWPGRTRHHFFPRHYTFAVNGREIGRATALYVLLDVAQRKIAPASRLATPVPDYDLPAPLPTPGAIAVPEGDGEETLYEPVYTDFDRNGHVNNARYVDWFANRFPCERYRRQELSQILIHYHLEVLPGERLRFFLYDQPSASVLKGMNGEQLSFMAKGCWRDR